MFVIPLAESSKKAKIMQAVFFHEYVSIKGKSVDFWIFLRFIYIHTWIIVYPSPPYKLNSANEV